MAQKAVINGPVNEDDDYRGKVVSPKGARNSGTGIGGTDRPIVAQPKAARLASGDGDELVRPRDSQSIRWRKSSGR